MIPGALLGVILAAGAGAGAGADAGAVAGSGPGTAADPCAGEDFQLCFDPGNRLGVTAAAAVTDAGELGVAYELGIDLGTERRSRTRGDLSWTTRHQLLRARLVKTGAEERLSGLAYRGRFDRHLEEGYLLLPTAVPTRVPFPFDLALEIETGAFSRTTAGDRLGVLSAALLLDPGRAPGGGVKLGAGPALSWSVSRRAGSEEVIHEVSPLTGGLLLLALTDSTGRSSAQARVHAGWTLVPAGARGLQGGAELSLERVILAVNDRPVSLRLAGSAVRSEVGVLTAGPVEWVASLGLLAAPF